MGNLQELVYKQGQAGVTKATVTIVFDNSDSSNSPVGYEHLKQITVSRQVCTDRYHFSCLLSNRMYFICCVHSSVRLSSAARTST